jgi:hypothetical protein
MNEKLEAISQLIESIAGKADSVMKIVQWLVSALKDFPKFGK